MLHESTWNAIYELLDQGFQFYLNSHNIEDERQWEAQFTKKLPETPGNEFKNLYWANYAQGHGETPDAAVRMAIEHVEQQKMDNI